MTGKHVVLRVLTRRETEFYPEVEVDDAGWGDLVGGVVIGGYNPLNGEFRWARVPVRYFQGEAFAGKDYLVGAKRAVNKVLGDLRADKRFHRVAMCTGYVLNYAARSLRQNGWRVVRRKIEGRCQELVEATFRRELINLGVPPDLIRSMPSGTNRFIRLFKWVKEDPEERERYVKTGWNSWHSKWRSKLWNK
ncbi:MAG: hypothetical protein ACE5Z5_02390 [Candidatus Bathyarchaeia archaeon]